MVGYVVIHLPSCEMQGWVTGKGGRVIVPLSMV